MAFDKETAKTANKFYTNGKGMYMLLFDTYSVITSGNSEGPTDDVYLKTESGNPVGAEWKDAVTNEPISLTISAGAAPIPFTSLVKFPEGAISIDKGSSIELSVQPQPADTTDSITYNWSVDDSYLSYSLNNNKCIITGVAAGSTTVTVTPVVNGTADASKAVSFATTVNVVVPTISIGSPDIASQKWQVGTAVSLDLVSHMSISASEGSLVFEAFECPAGITVSSSGIVSGTPAEDASGSILINVYVEGFRSDTIKSINLAYSIDAAAPTLTVSDPITPVQTWQATVAISSVNLMTLCGISTSDGSTPKFTSAYVPAGLTLSSNGILSGTPPSSTGPESFQVTVCIPGFEEETTKYIAVNYVINEAPPTLSYITTSVSMPEMTAGTEIQAYSIIDDCQLSTSNGTAVMFDVLTPLPEGLSLSDGIITGTPVSENSGSFELYAYPQGYRNNGVSIGVSYVINEAQGGGDTPGVTYLYTVSGSSRAEVNGDYWQDGTKNGKGKYTNGSCDMVWIGSYWAIGPIGYNGSGAPYHSCWEDIATPNLGSSWSGVTVTEYAGNSGEGGGDSGGTTKSGYKIACRDLTTVSGNYYEADAPSWGDSSYTWYKHETNNYYLYITSSMVEIRAFDEYGFVSPYWFANNSGTNPEDVTSITNDDSGTVYQLTITAITGGGSGSTADYIVSGAGTAAVNGDYVAYESSWTSYKHTTNDIWLWYDSNLMKWYICMTGPGITGVAEIYYETAVDCPDPTTAGWFTGIGSDPVPTVTKVGSSSSGGGSDGGTSNADYIVSGSSTTEVNGDYINTGRISNDRPVYTNDTYYMRWYSGMWEITEEDENSNMKPPKHIVSSSDMTPPASGWYGGITVTSGGNESSTPADYIVSGAGTEAVNGNYYATGEYYEGRNSAPIYKNKNGVYFFATGSHNIFANSITTDLNIETYYHCEAYGDYYTTGAWANDALYPTCGEFGIEPFPTVTKA